MMLKWWSRCQYDLTCLAGNWSYSIKKSNLQYPELARGQFCMRRVNLGPWEVKISFLCSALRHNLDKCYGPRGTAQVDHLQSVCASSHLVHCRVCNSGPNILSSWQMRGIFVFFLWNEHPPSLWWSTLQEINCRERESWDCAIQSQLHRKYLLPALHCHATNYIHYRHYILPQITFTTFSSTLSHRLHSLLCAIRNQKVNGTKNIHDADDKVKDQDSLSDKQLSSFLTGAVHHPWKLLWWSGSF